MPVVLPDDLALLLFRTMTKLPPVSGHVIIDMLTVQGKELAEQRKLLQLLQGQITTMSQTNQSTDQQFQAELASFSDDLKKQTTVANGLKVAFAAVAQQLAAATDAAAANGASEAELTSLRTLHADLLGNTATISNAVVSGTAAQNEPPAPVVPTTAIDPAVVEQTGGATVTGGAIGTAAGDATGEATGDATGQATA